MIYVIGDSHTCFFLGVDKPIRKLLGRSESKYPFFKVHYVGHATAYNLQNEDSASAGRKNLNEVLDKIPKGSVLLLCFGEIDCRFHLPKFRNEEECVQRYFQTILAIKDKFRVILWAVISKLENEITRNFNFLLRKEAKKYNITVIDMYEKLVGQEKYFISDNVHLSQEAMPLVLDELRRKNML